MAVQLFGATSSPTYGTFVLKQFAADDESEFGTDLAICTNDFYADGGLWSLSTSAEAISLIEGASATCKNGSLRLHKFLTNDKEDFASLSVEEWNANLENHDFLESTLLPETVLGVSWYVDNDTFGFKIVLKDMPFTKRGVLSTVSSFYDPLGFVESVILLGRQIIKEVCSLALDWDDSLPESLVPSGSTGKEMCLGCSFWGLKPWSFGKINCNTSRMPLWMVMVSVHICVLWMSNIKCFAHCSWVRPEWTLWDWSLYWGWNRMLLYQQPRSVSC